MLTSKKLHGVVSQKLELSITTDVTTSSPAKRLLFTISETFKLSWCLVSGGCRNKRRCMECDICVLTGKEHSMGRRCEGCWAAVEPPDSPSWTGLHSVTSYHRLAAHPICCCWWWCWVSQLPPCVLVLPVEFSQYWTQRSDNPWTGYLDPALLFFFLERSDVGWERYVLTFQPIIYCGVAPKGPLLTNGYASSIGFIGNDGTFTQQPNGWITDRNN
jgi:hypothetical protein